LCFAAAVAKAGFEISEGTAAAVRFERSLIEGTIFSLEMYFEQLGWSAEECSWRRIENDRLPDEIRKGEVLSMLNAELERRDHTE
jgi:hypothetical protein